MCWNQLLLAGLSTGSVYFLTVPSDHTVVSAQSFWTFLFNKLSKTKTKHLRQIQFGIRDKYKLSPW